MDPGFDPGMGMEPVPVEETIWDQILRFLKGLIGLDSAPPTQPGDPSNMPPMERPVTPPLGGKG
jgi:hypothetical protein